MRRFILIEGIINRKKTHAMCKWCCSKLRFYWVAAALNVGCNMKMNDVIKMLDSQTEGLFINIKGKPGKV